MLIQRGRDEGWLTQPVTTLPSWAAFNGVSFHGVEVNVVPGFENRGSAIVASATLADQDKRTLMTVPRSLVLSREVVDGFSKSDKCLREVLASLGDFGRVRDLSSIKRPSRKLKEHGLLALHNLFTQTLWFGVEF